MGIITNRRRVMGGNPLPYDAVVEYLESTGTQYIDTGVVGNGAYKYTLYVDDYFNLQHGGQWLFGSRIGYNNAQIGLFVNGNDYKVYFPYANTTKVFDLCTTYQNSCEVTIGSGILRIGDKSHTYSVSSFSNNRNIALFALNNNGNILAMRNIRIGYFRIENEMGVLLRDFIPVRVGQVGYMFDRVSKQLFGNAGTGAFVVGPDVNN